MTRRVHIFITAMCASGALLLVWSAPPAAATSASALGKQLVHRFFNDTKGHKIAALKTLLSGGFQLQRADGTRQTKAQFLAKLPDIRSFKLRNFRSTLTGQTLVVTYQAAADEIIDGKVFGTGFEPRLSVFVDGASGWQLVAHSNFNKPA